MKVKAKSNNPYLPYEITTQRVTIKKGDMEFEIIKKDSTIQIICKNDKIVVLPIITNVIEIKSIKW